jgi:subtilase family serine protease
MVLTPVGARNSEWERHPHLSVTPQTPIHFTVTLAQRNLDWLQAEALVVSDPASPKYGTSYSIEAIARHLAPPPAVLDEVYAWLMSIHPTVTVTLGQSRDVFFVEAPVFALEKALQTQFSFWRHRASRRVVLRTLDLPETYTAHVPPAVAAAIDCWLGVHDFFSYPSEKKQLRRLLATAHSPTPSSSAPDILPPIASGASTLSVSAVVYCANGLRTQNATQPCADYPPMVSVLVLQVADRDNVWSETVQLVPAGHCIADAAVAGVVCTFSPTTIPAFQRVTLSAWAIWANGIEGDKGTFVTPFSPSDWTTPQLIHQLYGIPTNIRGHNPHNSQCVVAFEEQYISLGDLFKYYDLVGLPHQPVTIIGPNDPSQPGGESTLDIQSITGVAPGVPTTFWSFGGNVKAPGGYILEFFIALNNDTNAPLVSSISCTSIFLFLFSFSFFSATHFVDFAP